MFSARQPHAAALVAAVALTAVALGGPVRPGEAHGGYPLSVAATKGGNAGPALRLVLVYLGEGHGMNVQPLFFESEAALVKAYDEGKADLVVHAPSLPWSENNCRGTEAEREAARAGYVDALFKGSWSKAFPATASGPCGLSMVAHPRVTKDIRFSLLRANLEKLIAAVDGREMAALRTDGGSDARSQAAAARVLLRREGLL